LGAMPIQILIVMPTHLYVLPKSWFSLKQLKITQILLMEPGRYNYVKHLLSCKIVLLLPRIIFFLQNKSVFEV
jgi:hypothetical protein